MEKYGKYVSLMFVLLWLYNADKETDFQLPHEIHQTAGTQPVKNEIIFNIFFMYYFRGPSLIVAYVLGTDMLFSSDVLNMAAHCNNLQHLHLHCGDK